MFHPTPPWSGCRGSMVYGHPSQISNPEKNIIRQCIWIWTLMCFFIDLLMCLLRKMDWKLGIQSNYITGPWNPIVWYPMLSLPRNSQAVTDQGLLVVAKLLPLSSGLDDSWSFSSYNWQLPWCSHDIPMSPIKFKFLPVSDAQNMFGSRCFMQKQT